MSQLPTPSPHSRPTLLDFVLLLAGATLSLYLMRLSPLHLEVGGSAASADPKWAPWHDFLPVPLRIGEGIILLWPLFFLPQRLLGRKEGLTLGEWLWVFAWLGVALITALGVWEALGGMPDFVARHASKPRLLWYLVFAPALAVLAAVVVVLGVFRRQPAPWTHTLGLALMLWPALPLGMIYSFGSLR